MDFFTSLLRSTASESFANSTPLDLALQLGVLLVATLSAYMNVSVKSG
jgi:hypothetical protein